MFGKIHLPVFFEVQNLQLSFDRFCFLELNGIDLVLVFELLLHAGGNFFGLPFFP